MYMKNFCLIGFRKIKSQCWFIIFIIVGIYFSAMYIGNNIHICLIIFVYVGEKHTQTN